MNKNFTVVGEEYVIDDNEKLVFDYLYKIILDVQNYKSFDDSPNRLLFEFWRL